MVDVSLRSGVSTPQNVTGLIYSFQENVRGASAREFRINTTNDMDIVTDYKVTTSYDINNMAQDGWRGGELALTKIQREGMTLIINYGPNFFLDAWKIDGVSMTVRFTDVKGNSHPTLGEKTILFSRSSALLNEANRNLVLGLDGFLMQRP